MIITLDYRLCSCKHAQQDHILLCYMLVKCMRRKDHFECLQSNRMIRWYVLLLISSLFMMTSSNGKLSALLALSWWWWWWWWGGGGGGGGIRRLPVNSPYKDQWRGALMVSLICAWINGWVSNREADDLKRNYAHYDVTAMYNVTV